MRADVIRGNVFVANLPTGTTDEQLAELFDPYGIVVSAHLARDPATGALLGHGLVELAPDRVVDEAIVAVKAAGVGGRRVDVRRADPGMSISLPQRPSEARYAAPRPKPYAEARPARAVIVETKPSRGRTLTLSSTNWR